MDNPFILPTDGQADWDSSLNANFSVIERGYHVTERAGTIINTGQVLFLNSGGFFFPFNAASQDIYPTAYAFTAAASGDTLTALAWGIVRSLGVNSALLDGQAVYVTSGAYLTNSYANEFRKVGRALDGWGVLFAPSPVKSRHTLGDLIDVNTTGIMNDSILKWSNASSHWIIAVDSGGGGGGGGSTMGALTDVDTTGVTDDSILKWSNTTSKWVVSSIGGGSGGSQLTDVYTTGTQSLGWDFKFSAGVTLSSNNKIATPLSGGPYNHIYGHPARYSGKRYYEFIVGNNGFAAVGVAGSQGRVYGGSGNTLGQANIIGQVGWQNGGTIVTQNYITGGDTIATAATWTASVFLGIAIDIDNGLMWCRVNTSGTWNNSASADPASGIGGFDMRYALAGGSPLLWPAASFGNTAPHALYVTSTDVGVRLPSGYLAWGDA